MISGQHTSRMDLFAGLFTQMNLGGVPLVALRGVGGGMGVGGRE